MKLTKSLIYSLITLIITNIGILTTYINKKSRDKLIIMSLTISSTIMILISLKELIPISSKYIISNTSSKTYYLILLILTIIVIIIIKKIRVEKENTLYQIGILNTIVLFIHNIPEGILIYITSNLNTKLSLKLFLSIMLHNIPEGISIIVPIYYSTKSRGVSLLYCTLSSLAETIGIIITHIFLKYYLNELIINIILLFTGILMTIISINKIIPEVIKYHKNKYILYGVVVSLIINILIQNIVG